MTQYEVYKGDCFVAKGTASELSRRLNVSENYIRVIACEPYHDKLSDNSNSLIAFSDNLEYRLKREKEILQNNIDKVIELYFYGYKVNAAIKLLEYI